MGGFPVIHCNSFFFSPSTFKLNSRQKTKQKKELCKVTQLSWDTDRLRFFYLVYFLQGPQMYYSLEKRDVSYQIWQLANFYLQSLETKAIRALWKVVLRTLVFISPKRMECGRVANWSEEIIHQVCLALMSAD